MSGQKYIEIGKAEMPINFVFPGLRAWDWRQIKSTSAYEKDKKYWEDRVETFADAPDLLLAKNEARLQSSVSVAGAQNCHRKNGCL